MPYRWKPCLRVVESIDCGGLDIHETVEIRFEDVNESFFITVRRGIVEIKNSMLWCAQPGNDNGSKT